MLWRGVAVLATVLLFAACSRAERALEPLPPEPIEAALVGRDFVAAGVSVDGERWPGDRWEHVNVSFGEGRIAYDPGPCRDGRWSRWAEFGPRIVLGGDLGKRWIGPMPCVVEVSEVGPRPVTATTLAYDPEWFTTLMEARPGWKLENDHLTLTAGSMTMRLVDRRVDDPRAPLTYPTWYLQSATVNGQTLETVKSKEPHLAIHFAPWADYSGSTACNAFVGDAEVGDGFVNFTDFRLGPEGCAEPFAAVERAMQRFLDGRVEYEIRGVDLRLTKSNGDVMRLTRQLPVGGI